MVGIADPRSYIGFPGGHVAPRGCFFASRNVSEASGSKRTPRVKRYVPSTNETIYRGVTCFLMVMMKMYMFVSGYRYGYLVAGYTDRERKCA